MHFGCFDVALDERPLVVLERREDAGAERAARAIGCTGAVRVDVLVTEGENEYVLEVNTLPGMTPTSLLPKIAAAAGIDYASLCEAILSGARLHAGLNTASVARAELASGVTLSQQAADNASGEDDEQAIRRTG